MHCFVMVETCEFVDLSTILIDQLIPNRKEANMSALNEAFRCIVSGELDIRLRVKLQLKIPIPPSPWPLVTLALVTRGGLERYYFCVTGQGSKPRPRPGLAALASPTSDQWSPEVPLEDPGCFPFQEGPLIGLCPGPSGPGCGRN